MAVRGVINEFFNIEDFQKQLAAVTDGVNKYIDLVKGAPSIRAGMSDPSKIKETVEGMKQLSEQNKAVSDTAAKVADEQKKLADTLASLPKTLQDNISKQVEYKNRLTELGSSLKDLKKQQDILEKIPGNDAAKKEIKDRIQLYSEEQAKLKVLNTDLTRTINAQVKEGESAANSIDNAKASVARLTAERNKINVTTEEGRVKVDALNKAIDAQNDFLKVNASQLEKVKINIGNYEGSAAIIVEALKDVEKEITNLQQKQQGLVNLSKTNPIGFKLSGGADELNRVNAQLGFVTKQAQALNGVTSNPQFLNIASKVGDTNKELRFFQQQLNTLEDAGLKNSQVYQDVQTRLAKLTDQIGDTRAQIKALSSDSRGVDLFAGSVAFAADVFQTAAGASALFGASQEKVAVITKNLIAIQSVSNGVKGIAKELTTEHTAANKAFVFVQGLVATSLDSSAKASKRFIAALGLIGIAATVIGAIVIAFAKFNKAADETITRQKVLNDITKEAASNYGTEKAQLDQLVSVIRQEGATRADKLNALKELQEKYPGYFDNLKTEKDLNNDLAAAYANAAAGILDKARAQAGADRIAKNEAERLNLELDFANESLKFEEGMIDHRQKLRAQDRKQFEIDLVKERDLRKTTFEQKKAEIEKENKIILDLTVNATKKNLQDKNKPDPKDAEKAAKEAKERADRELQVQFEIRKVQLQQLADFNKEVADNEKEKDLARLFALNQFVLARKEIIDRQADIEVKIGTKTASEIKLIEEKRIDESVRLGHEAEEVRLKIVQSEILERSKMTDEEKKILAKKAEEISKNFEENEKKKREAAKKTLEERKKIAEEEKELQKRLYDELTTTLTVFFTAGLERRKNDIQGQLDLLDVQTEKEIEVASKSVGTEQERADKIQIIEARANAKKQQLEREQRRIQQEQAKFQKAAQIVKIIGDTASAIMATLARTPPPAGIPLAVLTGAIGAAQLAAVIAQPIPKYAKGTGDKNHQGGLAIVGDGGKSEGVKLPDGTVLKTPSTDTLVDLPKGSRVFPDFNNMLLTASIKEIPDIKVKVPFDKAATEIREMRRELVKTIKDKQENHWHFPSRYETAMRDGSRFRAYLNDNL